MDAACRRQPDRPAPVNPGAVARDGARAVVPTGALVALLVLVQAGWAFAAPPPCVAHRAAMRADPARCPVDVAGRTAGAVSFEALLARADALRADDDIDRAEAALACAATRIAERDDPHAHYEVVRRFGIVEYTRDQPAEALASFECALGLARRLGDRAAVAKQLKNVGSSLRRIGDYAGAMRALSESLRIQREIGDTATGPVLNNIADVYRDLEQPTEAEPYYREALEAFRSGGDYVQAMHVYDSLSTLALDRRDAKAAMDLLETALRDLREAERIGGEASAARRYQLMILAGLTRAAIADGDVARARDHVADADALAGAHDLPIPAELALESARVERLGGRPAAAIARLRAALAGGTVAPALQASMLRELSLAFEQSGRGEEALVALRDAYARDVEDLRAQRDRGLAWSNARFNLSESRRRLAAAEEENRRRVLQLWLIGVSALAALSLLVLFFLRRQQRAREAEAARRARYEEALLHYRREADTLAQDRRLLQTLLDSRDDALVLLDADGAVLAANRAACEVFGVARDALAGQSLPERFGENDAAALRAALEHMEDAHAQWLDLCVGTRAPVRAELRQWQGGDGLIVVAFARPGDAVPAADFGTASGDEPSAATPEAFRRTLVELMLMLVDAWERSTGLNRIELAERSRIWRINIDDGRLRARAMERYLSLSKLPRNPRWRDVLRSAYFVLGQCEKMPGEMRDELQRRVDAVLEFTRRDALV